MFFFQVMHSLQQVARRHDFYTLFHVQEPRQDQLVYMPLIRKRHMDGIVLSGPWTDDTEGAKLHRERASIALLAQLPKSDLAFANVDNVGGA